jgi:hypothetical protein
MEADPFDDLLGLEEQFYNEGFQLGKSDGAKAGRIEGRVFGLEKGFEKYVDSGRLHGRSLVWASRLPKPQASNKELQHTILDADTNKPTSSTTSIDDSQSSRDNLPRLPENPRLEKHLRVLYALTEPASSSTENTEDAVSDFDDRLKRAKAKVKVIERLIGESGLSQNTERGTNVTLSGQQAASGGNIEDVSALNARH